MKVVVLRWPTEGGLRVALRATGVAILMLVESGSPPQMLDELEDWIRMPASEEDLAVRMATLDKRYWSSVNARPVLDDFGVLHWAGQSAVLSPVEAKLVGALVQRFGAVVARDALEQTAWPSASRGRGALDVHITRLRRRIAPLHLVIRTVRSRGYLLERSPAEPVPAIELDPGRPGSGPVTEL